MTRIISHSLLISDPESIQIITIMFFTQSSVVADRKKQPHQLFQRVISKPQRGIDQLRQYISLRVRLKQFHQIQSIINYITFRNTHQINIQTRIILLNCFQAIALQIKDIPINSQLSSIIPQIITILLNNFKDPIDKVRYQAIGSIYNIICSYNASYLPMFTKTFNSLLTILNQQSSQMKLVIFHLNHSLKRLLNLLISVDQYFDVNQFMALLVENFIVDSTPNLKEFLIDWLIAIDEIPEFQVVLQHNCKISFYLPLVFKQLFKLMEGENEALRDKSEQCLKNFLSGFKQLLRNRVRIQKKIREDSFAMLMSVLLQVIKQSLNPKIKYHSLEWLQVFTQLFYNELIKKDHVQVRKSFRSEYLLKEMRGNRNHQRTTKILSFIREEMMEGDSEMGAESMNLMNGIDFLPTPRLKDKTVSLAQENLMQEENTLYLEQPYLQKAVTTALETTEFFVEIFLSFYDKIIVLVMHSFSHDDQKIRKITTSVNNILLQSFPIVQEKAKILKSQYPIHTIITTQSQSYLEKLQIPLIIKLGKFLKQSRTSHKIQAIIKWIKILYEKGQNPQLNLQISQLIQKIVEKICQKPVTNLMGLNSPIGINNRSTPIPSPLTSYAFFNFNKGLFSLLADSIFMQKYLDLFIQTLLSYFYQNEGIDFERILIDVISMKIKHQDKNDIKEKNKGQPQQNQSPVDNTQLIYITILKRLMLFEAQKGRFKQKMIQNMISILITQNSLSGLRKKLRSTSIRQKYLQTNNQKHSLNTRCFVDDIQILQLIQQLFEYFCLNQGFTIIFCFLTGMYSLINKILKYIAEQNLLDRQRIKSFIKASNLLECYNLNHCKIDILKSYMALKAYLGYLMVIPPSKLNKVLLNRFPQDFVLEVDDPETEAQSDQKFNEFEDKLFESYLRIMQKHNKDAIIMVKQEQKRKQRQRQASMTIGLLGLNKEFSSQMKPRSKSILKPTSLRILKQSQSEKQLKLSPSFAFPQPQQKQKRLSFAQIKKPTLSNDNQKVFNTEEQNLLSQSYPEPQNMFQLSDESLQLVGSQNGFQGRSQRFEKSQEQLNKEQAPKRKKKKSLVIKVVDMQIE